MSHEENQFRVALDSELKDFGLEPLSEKQSNQLIGHYSMLQRWNRRTNLTRIIEPREAARFHYAESLLGARFINGARSLLDIGSGAGFPAVPIAIARPDVEVVALEANQKKSLFLNEAKDELGLGNFKVATARLESFDLSRFGLLASRALDRAEELLPSVVGQLGERQRLMLYCSPDLVSKLERAVNARIKVETHSIPQAASRIIAIFSRD